MAMVCCEKVAISGPCCPCDFVGFMIKANISFFANASLLLSRLKHCDFILGMHDFNLTHVSHGLAMRILAISLLIFLLLYLSRFLMKPVNCVFHHT